ncbi:helix-turn-helix domain-containing protein [Streptomyces sp. NPDC055254]
MPDSPKITQCRIQPTDFRSWLPQRGQVPRSVPPSDDVLARRRRIGARIRAAREHRNLTQERVANEMGMDRPSYILVEQGKVSPMLDTLLRISDALGVPLSDLVRE